MSKISIEVSAQACADIICTALEGGIGYWAQAAKIKTDENGDYVSCMLCECNDEEDFVWHPVDEEGKVLIHLLSYNQVRVGIERILTGQVKISRDLFAQVATAGLADEYDIDASAADCIVQAGLLNEIRYG